MITQLHMSPAAWQALLLAFLTFGLVVAVVSDAAVRRIPNTVVLTLLLAGVVLHTIGPTPTLQSTGIFSLEPAALGFLKSMAGALIALLVFLPFYAIRALGAGDVKLLSGVGAFAGTAAFLNIALWVLLAGGVLAVIRLAITGHPRLLMANMTAVMTGQFKPAQTLWRMPYAVAIAMGVAAHAAWVFSGRTPILNF